METSNSTLLHDATASASAESSQHEAIASGGAVEAETARNSISSQKRKLSSGESPSAASSAPDPDAVKMFVGQIPKSWDEADARKFFEGYGELHQVYILRDKSSHASKGCCFVTYCSREAALQAQHLLHDVYQLPGMKHAIQMKPADAESKNERKLFVGMIPKSYDEQDVERLFSPYGIIEETSILRDNAGKSRGCAFVTFQTKSSVYQSIRGLHLQTTLPGCAAPMVVKLADSQRDRDRRRSVQALLGSMGIDCRTANGTSLLKLFSGSQQPFGTLELNAIRQLILSSGNTLSQYTNSSVGTGRNSNGDTNRNIISPLHSMPAQPGLMAGRLLYTTNDAVLPLQNKYITTPGHTLNSVVPETTQNSATLQLLKQFLSGSNNNTRTNATLPTAVGPSNALVAQSQLQAGVSPTPSLLSGILSALTKSLAAAANPPANEPSGFHGTSAGEQHGSYAAPHNHCSNGYTSNANVFAGYNYSTAASTSFDSGYSAADYGTQQRPATQSYNNNSSQQSKRQRFFNHSAVPGRGNYDYPY